MLARVAAYQIGSGVAHDAYQMVYDEDSVRNKNAQSSELDKLLNASVLRPLKVEFQKILGIELDEKNK